MFRFILNRVAASAIVMLAAISIVFFAVRALPGGPGFALAGGMSATPEAIARVNAQLGLDQPLPVQYWKYISQLAQGDFGMSTLVRAPVSELLALRLPVTLQLAAAAILIGVIIGIPAGLISASRRGTGLDYGVTVVGLLGLSIPHFWFGMLLILLFALTLGWLPASGLVPFSESPGDWLRSMILPSIALGTGLAAVLMRQTRSGLLGQLNEDYVRTARAKGLAGSAQTRHAARNSMTTVITVLGLELGALISGAVIVETVFAIPGFGKLIVEAVTARDYAVVQAAVIITVAAYVFINLAIDVLYAVADPRVRLGGVSE